ncbi:type 1 fimbrial protein [Escherichia coli]|nr:type 1 fimbrial protein [Escherichia coli]EGF7412907.1 type 1 fimbrial protein [Escherichia coli]EGF7454055.1 type 1 fimbrial protein [Escherichia coli]
MHKINLRTAVKCFIMSVFLFFTSLANAVEVSFDGELVEYPCQIDISSDGQTVQFMERPVKDFHTLPGKGPAEKFSIRMINCSAGSAWKTVKLKFSGDKEPEMKEKSDYFLKVSGSGNEGKLAVGVLDTDGVTQLKLEETHNNKNGTPLTDGSITLDFKAFVQATPSAIANKSVQPGSYSSMVKFEVAYE